MGCLIHSAFALLAAARNEGRQPIRWQVGARTKVDLCRELGQDLGVLGRAPNPLEVDGFLLGIAIEFVSEPERFHLVTVPAAEAERAGMTVGAFGGSSAHNEGAGT